MTSELSGYQKELLAHIEFIGRFYGVVSRADLVKRFDISEASATRTFQLYHSIAPDNLIYRPNIRRYEWQDNASPVIEVSINKCLSTLTDGFGDSFAHATDNPFAVKNSLFHVNLDILAGITRAIKRKYPITINYLSKSSPQGATRQIVPHSIADSGLRWHVRAFDRKRNEFRDFVINRVSALSPCKSHEILPHEERAVDDAWNTIVELELQPHPRLGKVATMIEFEYQMVSGILKKRIRQALAGYLLDSWNIDSSPDASLTGQHILLHLKNSQQLNFSSKRLAPGIHGYGV
ncbi:WYL domain-containing protein [Idiomarina fontislapidosi]|uniref:WYL domain-containing protein n=1 Tax=Idiomarina fontislapidosi TaxID=263723 RepID=A0A432XR13_9GAMM|nr:WYL domain-containing protein [Idiomarina fontislapidosi]PYE30809.1 WYL domain-containing protein [Idiomarina fontislapidosi]RUO51175.1 WYL domain-containing protein [Idiomarina fontislapidosi]